MATPRARRSVNPELLPKTHDGLFRAVFSRQDICADLLGWRLSPCLHGSIADRPPRPEDKDFLDEGLRTKRADLLLRVFVKSPLPVASVKTTLGRKRLKRAKQPAQAEGEDEFVHLLLEHKSKPLRGIHTQLLGYHLGIMKRQAEFYKAEGQHFKYRPIIKWVVYNGTEPWTVPLHSGGQFKDYGEWSESAASLFHSAYELLDLWRIPVEDIAPGFPRLAACLIALRGNLSPQALKRHRQLRGAKPEPSTAELLTLLAKGLRGDPGLAEQVMWYIVANWHWNDEDEAIFEDTVAELLDDEQRGETMVTFADKIGERAVEKARPAIVAQALAQGMAQGMTQGMARTLVQMLEQNFGTLTDEAKAYVMQANPDELSAWTERVLDAPTLEAVFRGDGNGQGNGGIPPRLNGEP